MHNITKNTYKLVRIKLVQIMLSMHGRGSQKRNYQQSTQNVQPSKTKIDMYLGFKRHCPPNYILICAFYPRFNPPPDKGSHEKTEGGFASLPGKSGSHHAN